MFDTETTGLVQFRKPSTDLAQPDLVQLGFIVIDITTTTTTLAATTTDTVHNNNTNTHAWTVRNKGSFLIQLPKQPNNNTVATTIQSPSPPSPIISDGAYKTHGISDADCTKYGLELELVVALFDSILEQVDMVVGHNLKFDTTVMETAYHRNKNKNMNTNMNTNKNDAEDAKLQNNRPFANKQLICTMMESVDVCKIPSKFKNNTAKKYKWPSLLEAYKFIHINNDNNNSTSSNNSHGNAIKQKLDLEESGHDALIDAEACLEIFQYLVENEHVTIPTTTASSIATVIDGNTTTTTAAAATNHDIDNNDDVEDDSNSNNSDLNDTSTIAKLEERTVRQLKDILRSNGLHVSGTKSELIERIIKRNTMEKEGDDDGIALPNKTEEMITKTATTATTTTLDKVQQQQRYVSNDDGGGDNWFSLDDLPDEEVDDSIASRTIPPSSRILDVEASRGGEESIDDNFWSLSSSTFFDNASNSSNRNTSSGSIDTGERQQQQQHSHPKEVSSARNNNNSNTNRNTNNGEAVFIFGVRGNTYPHKETIKRLGGKWNGQTKEWNIDRQIFNQLDEGHRDTLLLELKSHHHEIEIVDL